MLDQSDDEGWAAAYGAGDTYEGTSAAVITQAAESIDEPTQPWVE